MKKLALSLWVRLEAMSKGSKPSMHLASPSRLFRLPLPTSLIALGLVFFGCSEPSNPKADLEQIARKAVLAKLVSPATASFPPENVRHERSANLHYVALGVDSQNVFGGLVRTYYIVELREDSGSSGETTYWPMKVRQVDENPAAYKTLAEQIESSRR